MPRTRDVTSCPDQDAPRRLLLIQLSSSRDGSTLSGLQLLDSFKEAGWETHVFFGHDGPMVETYADHGHATQIRAHKNWLRQPMPWQFLRNRRHAQIDGRDMLNPMGVLEPTLVYVNSGASYAGAWAAKKLGIPAVWHVRELMSDEGGELYAPLGFRRTVRQAFRSMTQSRVANSRHVARAVFGNQPDVHVVHNAVDDHYLDNEIDRGDARSTIGFSGQDVVVGIPGTMRPMKGHAFALNALQPWLVQEPDRRIAITGNLSSPYARSIRGLCGELGLEGRVDFLGDIRDMRVFYRACDIVLVPSSSEPFGRVAIEAMACGSKLVSTRAGGLPEIVEHGVNGLMIDYGDQEGLRNAIRELCQNSSLGERLSAKALCDVRQHFNLAEYRQRLAAVVMGVVKHATQRSQP